MFELKIFNPFKKKKKLIIIKTNNKFKRIRIKKNKAIILKC